MTHTEALEAAARALTIKRRANGFVDRDQAAHDVVKVYLTAFGVRDLGALVEAARDAREFMSDFPEDEHRSCAIIDAALTPAPERADTRARMAAAYHGDTSPPDRIAGDALDKLFADSGDLE